MEPVNYENKRQKYYFIQKYESIGHSNILMVTLGIQFSLPVGSVVIFNLIFQLRNVELISWSLPLRVYSTVLMLHDYKS